MRRVVFAGLIAGLVMGFAVVASADQAEAPFTARELDKFLDDWPRFVQWAEERGRSLDALSGPAAIFSVLPGYDGGAFLRGLGWEPERFYYVSAHAWMALLVIETREKAPEMIAGIEMAIASIRDNPRLTAAQKREAIAEFEEVKAMFMGLDSVFEVDESEVSLVQTRKDRVRTVLGIK